MKIAIIGYGKMGRMIEQIAKDRGHEISIVVDADNSIDIDSKAFRKSDVAIEFTSPSAAVNNLLKCFSAEVPVVCGTTGWLDSLNAVKAVCDSGKGTLMYSSNYSVGVNIFEAVNRYLARIMNDYPQYTPSMEEVHHIHKLDHPSGTAITIAEELIANYKGVTSWKEPAEKTPVYAEVDGEQVVVEEVKKEADMPEKDVLYISHRREGEVPGIHTVSWDSPQDTITISHSAKSREGFALGAVLAAEWLYNKTKQPKIAGIKLGHPQAGYFTTADMYKF